MKKINIWKDNKIKLIVLTHVLLFIVLCGVNNTYIYYANLVPFGIGIVFALFSIGMSGYWLSIVYFLSYNIMNLTISALIVSINVVLVLCILQYLREHKKYSPKTFEIFIFALMSQVAFVITNLGGLQENLALFVSVILSLIFLYVCMTFFVATFKRGMMVKLSIDEKICGAILLLVFILGMSACNLYIINLGLIFVTLIILVTTFIYGGGTSIAISALMGIGFAINYLDPIYISLFVFMALVSISFKCNFKYLSAFAIFVAYFIFVLFFNVGWSLGEILSVIIGVLTFVFIPLKLLEHIADMFAVKGHVLSKNLITRSKDIVIKRVRDLSVVFSEMDRVYRDMVRGVLSDDKAKEMLKDELVMSLCNTCENKNICFRANGDYVDASLKTIVDIAYSKGKVLLIDLPQYLTTNCNKLNQMIMSLNNMVYSYKEYAGAITNLDTSRVLIADQLNGVSKLLETLSHEVDINIKSDSRCENRIKEDLNYKGVVCLDCAVYEKDIQTKFITLIVKTDTIDKKKIEKCVSKIVGLRMMIKDIEPSEINDTKLITLITRPNYDLVFGSACVSKAGIKQSGDSHSLIKIDDGKFMVSICDGMGSGETAHSISTLTITLIENFYKAGFDNDIILSSVNKLVNLTEQEHFSTIDLCVIDARKNTYDFIKLGATNGYIKHEKGDVEIVESSGLPVGVLEDIKPHVTRRLVSPYDIVVFMSDGVSDSFENKLDLSLFLSSIASINPQTVSEEILNKALELSQNIPKDDMTVVCVRVIENV